MTTRHPTPTQLKDALSTLAAAAASTGGTLALFTPEACKHLRRLIESEPEWLDRIHRPFWEEQPGKLDTPQALLTEAEWSAWAEALQAAAAKLTADEFLQLDRAASALACYAEAAGFLCGLLVASAPALIVANILSDLVSAEEGEQ